MIANSQTRKPPESEAKHSSGLGRYVLWAFFAVMMYVLSSGPIMRWQPKLPGPVDHYSEPAVWAYWETPLKKPLGMYWHLWWPAVFDSHGNHTTNGMYFSESDGSWHVEPD